MFVRKWGLFVCLCVRLFVCLLSLACLFASLSTLLVCFPRNPRHPRRVAWREAIVFLYNRSDGHEARCAALREATEAEARPWLGRVRRMAWPVKTPENCGEHQNWWQVDQMDVPPQNGIAIGYAPWPRPLGSDRIWGPNLGVSLFRDPCRMVGFPLVSRESHKKGGDLKKRPIW